MKGFKNTVTGGNVNVVSIAKWLTAFIASVRGNLDRAKVYVWNILQPDWFGFGTESGCTPCRPVGCQTVTVALNRAGYSIVLTHAG